jgi:hypothetical protein
MTITTQTLRNDYTANGVNTSFAFTFPIFYESNATPKFSLEVILTDISGVETIKTETVDYTITYTTIENGIISQGNVVFNVAPTNQYKVTLLRKVNLTQNSEFTASGTDKFNGATLEASLDKLTLLALQTQENLNRVVKLPKSSALTNIEFPINSSVADEVICVNSAGNNLSTKNLIDVNLAPVSTYIKTLLDDNTSSQARATLDAQQLNTNLNAFSNLTGASNKLPYFTGSGTMAVRDLLATNAIQGISYLPQKITIANNTSDPNNDIDFSGGNFVFSDFSGQAYVPAMTKRLDANWTAGTNQGGLDTGTKANSTWYYCYAIYNPTTLVADYIFSANPTNPENLSTSGFIKYKYIGSILTNSSGNILSFEQLGDNYFEFITPILEGSGTTPSTRTPLPVSAPKNVIVKINATLTSVATAGTLSYLYLTDLNKTDTTSVTKLLANVNFANAGEFTVKTNSSSQIGIRGSGSSGSYTVHTIGFFDTNIKN